MPCRIPLVSLLNLLSLYKVIALAYKILHPSYMIQLIQDLNIDQLLGMDPIIEDEANLMADEISKNMIEMALSKQEENPMWNDAQKLDAKAFLDQNLKQKKFC